MILNHQGRNYSKNEMFESSFNNSGGRFKTDKDIYKVKQELKDSKGGCCLAVYIVTSERFNDREMALKCAKGSEQVEQMKRESEMYKEIKVDKTSSIIEFLDFHLYTGPKGYDEDVAILVTELARDGDLGNLLQKEGMIKNDQLYNFAHKMRNCLETLYNNGILHLDIKPQNLFVEGNDLWLGDFGLAEKLRPNSNAKHITNVRGTQRYMSPELLIDEKSCMSTFCSFFSDLWAFAICLHELFYDELPLPLEDYERELTKYNSSQRRDKPDIKYYIKELVSRGIDRCMRNRNREANLDDLLNQIFKRQITTPEALEHHFFKTNYYI